MRGTPRHGSAVLPIMASVIGGACGVAAVPDAPALGAQLSAFAQCVNTGRVLSPIAPHLWRVQRQSGQLSRGEDAGSAALLTMRSDTLVVQRDRDAATRIYSPLFHLPTDGSATVAFVAASSNPGNDRIRVSLSNLTRGSDDWVPITVTSEFSIVRRSAEVGTGLGRLMIDVPRGEGMLRITGVEVVAQVGRQGAGDLGEVWTDQDLALHDAGDSVTVHVSTGEPDCRAGMLPLSLRVETLGRRAALDSVLSAPGGMLANRIAIQGLEPGWYRAYLYRSLGGTEVRSVEWPFVVIPDWASPVPGSASRFGVHVELDDVGLRKAEGLGAGWIRLHMPDVTKWKVVQPAPTVWSWRDEPISRAHAAGFALLGTLDRTPNWASASADTLTPTSFYFGAAAYLPRDLAWWREYVVRATQRYRSEIANWQVWNEPDIQFLRTADGRSHVEAYLDLLDIARDVQATRGPPVTLVGPSVAYFFRPDPAADTAAVREGRREPTFLDGFLDAGGAGRVDVFSYHHYNAGDRSDPILLETSEEVVSKLDRVRSRNGAVRLWSTEGGIVRSGSALDGVRITGGTVDAERAAYRVVADVLAQLALGVERVFTYTAFFSQEGVETWNTFFDGRRPRPLVAAYSTLTRAIGNAQLGRPRAMQGGWEIRGTDGGRQIVVWIASERRAMRQPSPGAGVQISMFGRPVPVAAGQTIEVPAASIVYLTFP